MSQLILNVDDNLVPRVLDAFCWKFGYTGVDTIPAKSNFVRLKFKEIARDIVQQYELKLAEESARATALDSVNADFGGFVATP